jgi:large subunit ribosomal protein L15
MQLQDIKTTTNRKSKKRVGRGGKRGTYSGRGIKGQKARSGHRIRPALRDIIAKIPKKRGYAVPKIGMKYLGVNLGAITQKFESGSIITLKALMEKGLIKKRGGRMPQVKILGGWLDQTDGKKFKHKLHFKNLAVSKSAAEKIKEAGGEI